MKPIDTIEIICFVVIWICLTFYSTKNVIEPQLWISGFFNLPPAIISNSILTNSRQMSGEPYRVLAPESLAFHQNGTVFASTSYGMIVALNQSGHYTHDVFSTGKFMNNSLSVDWCRAEARSGRLGWNSIHEKKCGRPLGLRLVQSKHLYISDAYHGIFKIDLRSHKVEHIVTPSTVIATPPLTRSQKIDPTATLPPTFYNDVEYQPGIGLALPLLYFTDSSYKHTRAQFAAETIDGAPRGRLLAYDLQSKTLHVLLCGMHFPNGLQIVDGILLVAESTRFRVLRVDAMRLLAEQMKGIHHLAQCTELGDLHRILLHAHISTLIAVKEGGVLPQPVSVYLDALPGVPDNIRLTSDKRKLLIGMPVKSTQPFSLLHAVYQSTWVRRVIGRLLPLWAVAMAITPYGMVVVVDLKNMSVAVLQDPSGKVGQVSEAQVHPITGEMWIGSHHNPDPLAILDSEETEIHVGVKSRFMARSVYRVSPMHTARVVESRPIKISPKILIPENIMFQPLEIILQSIRRLIQSTQALFFELYSILSIIFGRSEVYENSQ